MAPIKGVRRECSVIGLGFSERVLASGRHAPHMKEITSTECVNPMRDGTVTIMTLNFPNQSRFYDSTRRAVRFWGYDTAMEASFFVAEDALKRVQPDMRFDEAGLLGAFDTNRELIYATASKVYARGRKGSYDLLSADF